MSALRRALTPEEAERLAHQDAHAAREAERVASVLRGGAPKVTAEIISIPRPPSESMTRKQAKAFRVRVKRAEEKQRAVLIQAQNAERSERVAEEVAPGVRRRAVTDAAGNVIRGPMLERDGVTFRRDNPIARLRESFPLVVKQAHVDAAARLLCAHEEVGSGIGLGSSDYLNKTAGTVGGAGVSDAKQRAILSQITMRRELDGGLAWMGDAGGVVGVILFQGLSLNAWAEKTGLDYRVGLGMLASALDRLVEFYEPEAPDRPSRIRFAIIGQGGLDQPVGDDFSEHTTS